MSLINFFLANFKSQLSWCVKLTKHILKLFPTGKRSQTHFLSIYAISICHLKMMDTMVTPATHGVVGERLCGRLHAPQRVPSASTLSLAPDSFATIQRPSRRLPRTPAYTAHGWPEACINVTHQKTYGCFIQSFHSFMVSLFEWSFLELLFESTSRVGNEPSQSSALSLCELETVARFGFVQVRELPH